MRALMCFLAMPIFYGICHPGFIARRCEHRAKIATDGAGKINQRGPKLGAPNGSSRTEDGDDSLHQALYLADIIPIK
jgi:hypothetical protein